MKLHLLPSTSMFSGKVKPQISQSTETQLRFALLRSNLTGDE